MQFSIHQEDSETQGGIMNLRARIFVGLVTLFCTSNAFSWGKIGHRIVGEIASQNLSSSAKHKVKELLGDETLAEVSNWADEIRSDPNYDVKMSPWHYATIADGKTYDPSLSPQGDVIKAINEQSSILIHSHVQSEKVRALKLLVHFVGDVHQPLHVGNEADQGGNLCQVKWFGATKTLHSLWDDEMIDFQKFSYKEYSRKLNHASEADIEKWQSTGALEWAKESQDIRMKIYPDAGKTFTPADRPYCKSDWKTIAPESIPNLKYDYEYMAHDIFERRLLQGGIRLAGVLNTILK